MPLQFEAEFRQHEGRETGGAPLVLAVPIMPGKDETWRRMCQEIKGHRRDGYEQARRALGVAYEAAWLLRAPRSDIAVLYLQANEPEHLLTRLAVSNHPFDRWFKRQLREICGLER
jgi:hypothetical protein